MSHRDALIGICLVGVLSAQGSPLIRSHEEARKLIGKVATVCGRVVSTTCVGRKAVTFLHISEPMYRGGLGIKIPDRALFGDGLENRYSLAYACATGRVERDGWDYSVLASSPGDIQTRDTVPPLSLPGTELYRPCDEGMTKPVMLREEEPPRRPKGERNGAEVLLEGIVLANGTSLDSRVIYSSDPSPAFGVASMAAFKTWKWRPARRHNMPVAVIVTVQVKIQ